MDIISSTPAPEQVLSSNSEVNVQRSCSKNVDNKSSNLPEEHTLPKKKRRRNDSPSVRVVGGRIYDSQNGRTCHQCRQKTMDIMASCKNHIKEKPCTIKYCHKCLLNRYGEKAEEVTVLEDWFCPKCKGICNCSFCRKKMGQQPTGILVHTAKSTGFSSVSEMLLVKGSDIQSVKESTTQVVIPRNYKVKEKSDEPKAKKAKRGKSNTDMEGIMHEEDDAKKKKLIIVQEETEIHLPLGSELRTVARIELQPEQVAHALQLLEFCAAFGEILELKKDEPEHILQELIRGGDGCCIGRSSPVAQFLVRLLSLIQTDSGESSSPAITHRLNHKTSWLLALHKCISSSPHLSRNLDKFDGGADSYNSLNSTERLTLVNFVCDEVLCTKKIRNWIDEQQLKCSERVKETKQKVAAAKQKEKQLKQKMKDVLAEAINAKNGVPLSNSEHTAIVSQIKMEAAQAHAEMLESKGLLSKLEKQDCISVRTKPILMDNGGRTFWRLNGCGDESRILLQETSLPDESEFRETWFTYEEEEQANKVKKYISFKEKNK